MHDEQFGFGDQIVKKPVVMMSGKRTHAVG
jgi:hypothetical protein